MSAQDPERPNAREIAFRRLSFREQSSSELAAYLRRKGVSEEEAAATVRELAEGGWVDDRRFSAAVARSEAAKGKGPMAVLAKLRRRGGRAGLNQARALFQGAAVAEDETQAVRAVLERRFPEIDQTDRKAITRVYQAMLRRGFSSAAIRAALKLMDEEHSDLGGK